MKTKEPLLFIDSPIIIRETKANKKATIEKTEDNFTQEILKLESLKKKDINAICLVKTKSFYIEDVYSGHDDLWLFIGNKAIKREDIILLDILSFEKR